jgi:hypothetical protein
MLLAGNTVVAKPAPTTPLTTLRFRELCAEILPAGVVNIIVDQNYLGEALTSHPDLAEVAFTGSIAARKKLMEHGAGTLKRLMLELGGNDAAIVLDDVDPKEIAHDSQYGSGNTGPGALQRLHRLSGDMLVGFNRTGGCTDANEPALTLPRRGRRSADRAKCRWPGCRAAARRRPRHRGSAGRVARSRSA